MKIEIQNRLFAMRAIFTPLLLLAGLTLSGCATAQSSTPEPEATASPTSSGSVEVEVGYAAAIAESYRLLYEVGMREEVTSAGDRYILSYAPQENFYAGLYNLELDDVIIIEQEEFFTVASAHLALQDPATIIVETETGVSLTNPKFGDFTVIIENGLVIAGFENAGNWTGTFSYEPDATITALVLAQLEEANQ